MMSEDELFSFQERERARRLLTWHLSEDVERRSEVICGWSDFFTMHRLFRANLLPTAGGRKYSSYADSSEATENLPEMLGRRR